MILHLGSEPPAVLEPGQLLSGLSEAEIRLRFNVDITDWYSDTTWWGGHCLYQSGSL